MGDRLVKIATFGNSQDAHMAKLMLAGADIESFIMGENLLMIVPKAGYPDIELHVPKTKAKEAVEILESQEEKSDEGVGDK